jgi:hypothetical protein
MTRLRTVLLAPVLAAMTALAACLPLGSLPSFPGPQSATAQTSTAEQIARGSVPVSGAIATAAGVGELVPGASVPATIVERYFSAYQDEMVRRINALDAKISAGQPVNSNEWVRAIVAAAGAGGLGILAGRRKSSP